MQSLQKDLRVCQVQLLWWARCLAFQSIKDAFNALFLLTVFEVVNAWSEEEPDTVGKEKVDLACMA